MQLKAFDRAKLELEIAQTKLNAMKQSKDSREISLLWSEFLTAVQRCFTKLRKATESGPSKGWMDQIFHTRSKDELLRYVMQARNADEHGIAPITDVTPNRIDIIEDKNVKKIDGRYYATAGKPVRFNYAFADCKLVPVINRGDVYNPPSEHLGKPIPDVTPLAVAEMALTFLHSVLTEAADKFS